MGQFKSKFCAFFTCFLVIFTVYAKSQVSLVSQRGTETVLTFQLSDYAIKNAIVNGEECNYIAVPAICYVHDKGYPQLPRYSESIIIPDNAEMGLEIVDIQYTEINVNKIVPSKGVIYRNQNPADVPYAFGAIYSKDAWYPEAPAVLGTPYILRDIRGIVVRFQPFQYNAVKGILKIAQTITVKIKEAGPGKINVLTSKNDKVSPSFSAIYKNHFINYSQMLSRYTPVPDGDKMIVICATALKADMATFVAWKNQKGIKTTLYEYPSQTGGTGTTALKTFIQGKYDTDKITYVLLVGDYAEIPAPDVAGGPADPAYAELKGSDLYPEVFIGRFSGSTSTYIQRMVNKVLKYEKEPDPSGTWYKSGMGIASADGSPMDKEWVGDMRTVMMGYNYTKVDEIYDPGASASSVTTGLNEGRSWVNYMGHGAKTVWGTTSYSNSSANSLTNTTKLPVIISVACNNGEFDGSGDCLGEAFLKSNGGAIVFLGSSISQAWNPPQIAEKEMVALLCQDSYISAGGIIYNGECEMLDAGNDQDSYETWILFGDPSLLVFTNTPTTMTVTPPTIAVGTQKVTVSFGGNIDGRACLYESANGVLGSAMVSKASSVQIDAVIPNVSKVTLTVTARNKVPYIAEITVGGSSIVLSDQIKNMKLQCIPNPVSATANITFANPMKHALVTIYSSDGKAVVSETVSDNHFTWNARGQTSGIYFVKVKVNGTVLEKRVCLMK